MATTVRISVQEPRRALRSHIERMVRDLGFEVASSAAESEVALVDAHAPETLAEVGSVPIIAMILRPDVDEVPPSAVDALRKPFSREHLAEALAGLGFRSAPAAPSRRDEVTGEHRVVYETTGSRAAVDLAASIARNCEDWAKIDDLESRTDVVRAFLAGLRQG